MTNHTFGGLAMLGRLIDFETPEGGGGDLAGLEGSEVTPAGATLTAVPDGTDDLDPDLGLEPAAPAAAGLTREDIGSVVQDTFQQMIAQAEAEERARVAAEQAAAPPDLPHYDPFDPQSVTAHVMATLQPVLQRIEEGLAQQGQVTEQVQNERGAAEAHRILDGLKGDVGDFDNERVLDQAALLANRDGIDPRQALEQAARAERAYIEKIEQGLLRRMEDPATALAGVKPEPAGGGAGGAGEVVPIQRGPRSYRDQLTRSLANMGRASGVGAATG